MVTPSKLPPTNGNMLMITSPEARLDHLGATDVVQPDGVVRPLPSDPAMTKVLAVDTGGYTVQGVAGADGRAAVDPLVRRGVVGADDVEEVRGAADLRPEPAGDEVGGLVLLPTGATTESDQIEFVKNVPAGAVYKALRPGLARVEVPGANWGVMVRVSRFQYAGLAQYRHLEETNGD